MKRKEQLQELFKAQDIIRRLWAYQKTPRLSRWLKAIDNEILWIINVIGNEKN